MKKILTITQNIKTSKFYLFYHYFTRQALNYEELIQNLKEQLDQFDFIAEHERAQEENEAYEEYYLEDYDPAATP